MYAVHCHMFCAMGTAASFIVCCVLSHVLCHANCYFLLLYAICCHLSGAKGIAATYVVYCVLLRVLCCGHCHVVARALLLFIVECCVLQHVLCHGSCFFICVVLYTATCYALGTLLFHILYAVCCCMFCAISKAASYCCMLCTPTSFVSRSPPLFTYYAVYTYASCFVPLLCCFTYCMLCAAACFVSINCCFIYCVFVVDTVSLFHRYCCFAYCIL